MANSALLRSVGVLSVLPLLAALAPQPVAKAPEPWPYPDKLAMVQRDVLAGVDGRLDHMAVDAASGHLYVAAIRNDSLEALRVADSHTTQSISDLGEPSGVAFAPDSRLLAVACDAEGAVRVYRAAADGTLTPERTVSFADGADNIRYDAVAKRVYVGHGNSLGSFLIESGEKGPDADLGGRPEAIAIETAGPRIFVNIPDKRSVAVVDRDKHAVVAEWRLEAHDATITDANFPICLDEPRHRLFVVTRSPARLFVLDTDSGRTVATVKDVARDADDCWYDAQTSRIFITGGGGSGEVTAVKQRSPDDYAVEFRMKTASGARTSLLVPEQRKLYVLAPRLGDDQAYVFIYLIGP